MKFTTVQGIYLVTLLRAGQTHAQGDSSIDSATLTFSSSPIKSSISLTSPSSSIESVSSISSITDTSSEVIVTPTASSNEIVSSTTDGSANFISTSSLAASSTLTPSATGGNTTASEDEFLPYGLTEGAESADSVPPDVTTPEQHSAEEEVNKPQTAISAADAREIAIMETVLFDHFVNNAPAPADVGLLEVPANVSSCAVALKKRGLVGGTNKIAGRSLVGWDNCNFVTAMTITLHYHYIKSTYDATRPKDLATRIKGSVDFLNTVYGPLGFTFKLDTIEYWRPAQSGSNSDWSEVIKNEARLQRWQRRTHTAGDLDLTIWAVNSLKSKTNFLNGYATFPEDVSQFPDVDGVVIDQERIVSDNAQTLVHEIGHWMGLRHTFGKMVETEAEDCKTDDGLLRTTLTPGWRSVVFDCMQAPCDGRPAEQTNNWMSYSECRGSNTELTGFHTDQKSAMFARVLKYRRGYFDGECQVIDPDKTQNTKRSSLQDLVDGQCPDLEEQAQAILAQPTLDPADAGTPSATPTAGEKPNACAALKRRGVGAFVVAVAVALIVL